MFYLVTGSFLYGFVDKNLRLNLHRNIVITSDDVDEHPEIAGIDMYVPINLY